MSEENAPRERARTHLRRLMETAAGAATLLACAGAGGGTATGGPGYGVVDPMPAPARCDDLSRPGNIAQRIYLWGQWDAKATSIDVHGDMSYQLEDKAHFGGPITATGGKIVVDAPGGTGASRTLTIHVTPDPGAKVIDLQVPMSCGRDEIGHYRIDLTTAPPSANLNVTVTHVDDPPTRVDAPPGLKSP